jgi:hypothetical protein
VKQFVIARRNAPFDALEQIAIRLLCARVARRVAQRQQLVERAAHGTECLNASVVVCTARYMRELRARMLTSHATQPHRLAYAQRLRARCAQSRSLSRCNAMQNQVIVPMSTTTLVTYGAAVCATWCRSARRCGSIALEYANATSIAPATSHTQARSSATRSMCARTYLHTHPAVRERAPVSARAPSTRPTRIVAPPAHSVVTRTQTRQPHACSTSAARCGAPDAYCSSEIT